MESQYSATLRLEIRELEDNIYRLKNQFPMGIPSVDSQRLEKIKRLESIIADKKAKQESECVK